MRPLVSGVVAWLLISPALLAQGPAPSTPPIRARVSDAFLDSVPENVTPSGVIGVSLSDAIQRALAYNLAVVSSRQAERAAEGERLGAASDLLPDLEFSLTGQVQQINLAAYGFKGFAGTNPVVGPFNVFDVRARLFQSIWDSELVHDAQAAVEAETAERFAGGQVRDLVVLVTTDLYLQALATTSRVEAARVQLGAAETFYQQAVDFEESGLVAGIDVLRAQVELERERGRLITLENDFARQKLDLARAIGLSLGQSFELTSSLTAADVDLPDRDEALMEAFARRPDYQHALALVRAAEEDLEARRGQRLPSLALEANYGVIGPSPVTSHGTFLVGGTLTVPLFRGKEIEADILEADSRLETRRAETAALETRIEYDVRSAYLDVSSAGERVQVAQSAQDLAVEELVQAGDRFAAGVAGSFEVVQAQQTLAGANDDYVAALYLLNLARAGLAHAIGGTEENIQRFLGGLN